MALVSIRKCLTSSLVKSPTGKDQIKRQIFCFQIRRLKSKVCLFTFFVLLDGRRGAGHLHGQAVGAAEGMAVPYDERPGLPVLQQIDGWKKERGGGDRGGGGGGEIGMDETERGMTRGKQDEGHESG